MSLNLNINKETTVGELERNFSENLIGMKFNVKNGLTSESKNDCLTIVSKKQGFGILFYSEYYKKEMYADSHLWLVKKD